MWHFPLEKTFFNKIPQPFLLALIYFITMILTEIASNAATAIIMTPITLSLAASFGFDPKPFIFAARCRNGGKLIQ